MTGKEEKISLAAEASLGSNMAAVRFEKEHMSGLTAGAHLLHLTTL
jgi:hypothetical protein